MKTKPAKKKPFGEVIHWPDNACIIGIDPGEKSGSVVVVVKKHSSNINRYQFPMPGSIIALRKLIRKWYAEYPDRFSVTLETPAGLPPLAGRKQGIASTMKFTRHVGRLEGLLDGMRVPWHGVTPQKWQNRLNCRTKGDKHISQTAAQRRFPDCKITLKNADSYLIAHYGCLFQFGEV